MLRYSNKTVCYHINYLIKQFCSDTAVDRIHLHVYFSLLNQVFGWGDFLKLLLCGRICVYIFACLHVFVCVSVPGAINNYWPDMDPI